MIEIIPEADSLLFRREATKFGVEPKFLASDLARRLMWSAIERCEPYRATYCFQLLCDATWKERHHGR